MTCVVAFGAVSGLGEGEAAFRVAAPGEIPRVAVARDSELERAGLARPYASRAPWPVDDAELADRALLVLDRAVTGCATMLDDVLPEWRGRRIGLCLGTSSGGLRSCEGLFDAISEGRDGEYAEKSGQFTYFHGLSRAATLLGIGPCEASLVLGACASSTLAVGVAADWLADGRCDLVLAGGYDAVGVFVASGFEAIRATSKEGVMRPFGAGRDGLVLGEGSAIVALVSGRNPRAVAYVRGFGASSDAVHLTAPDRTGGGLARAARAALAEAGPGVAVGLVSAHATATEFNDAAESRAIAAVLAHAPDAETSVTVHAFKPQIGHTLGAAGLLEALAAVDALRRGFLPATAHPDGPMAPYDPTLAVRPLTETRHGTTRSALKLSAAFGGANAALVLSLDPAPEPELPRVVPRRAVFVSRAVHVATEPTLDELAAMTGTSKDKLARTDRLSRFALGAVGELAKVYGPLDGAGIVVGHGLATHETNALFWAGIRRRGAALSEPRRFPFTSPNAPPGECSIAYRLTGPGLAVGLGPVGGLEAISVAADLVRAGRSERIVVVACDDVGPASARFLEGPSGAVALVVSAAPEGGGYATLVDTKIEVGHGPGYPDALLSPAHVALLPLCAQDVPQVLETGPTWGVFGRVRLRASS